MTVLPMIDSDSRIAVKFTVDKGSRYSSGLHAQLRKMGADVWSWSVACDTHIDLAIAAHVDANLAQLRAPLLVMPHGAGYNRMVASSTGGVPVPAGLSRAEQMCDGVVFATVIGLSHQEQLSRLQLSCPEAVSRALVIGDPTYDWILASRPRRDRYRQLLGVPRDCCLVVVSSTWNRYSTLGQHETLIHQLAAQLPMDGFRIGLVLHPNIWYGHSRYEIRAMLRDALDSGVFVIPPTAWEAAVLAADVIVGDHGSVSFYGVALHRPYLQAADGLAELDPDSPSAALARAAWRLDVNGDLRAQIEAARHRRVPQELTAITDRTLGKPGQSWSILRAKMYELLRLKPTVPSARMIPVPNPEPEQGNEVTAFLTSADVLGIDATSGIVTLERFPGIIRKYRDVTDTVDLFLVVNDIEVGRQFRQSAEIFVGTDVLSCRDAALWSTNVLADYPGAAMAATATEDGCLLRWRSGRLMEATVDQEPVPGVFITAASVYGWLVAFHRIDSLIRLEVRLGSTTANVVARPVR